MAKDDGAQADEQPVDEKPKQVEEPKVELDKPNDVDGVLIENPVLEEEKGEADEEAAVPVGAEAETEEGEAAPAEAASADDGEKAPDIQVEVDETGVYDTAPLADPGEFKPGDHSFTITIDGTRHKIGSIEEADKLIEQISDSKQLIRFMDKRSDMRMAIEKDRESWQTEQEQFKQAETQREVRDGQIRQWDGEVKYLEAKGLIPKISTQVNADWLANSKDPAAAARLEIFQWMDKENQARRTAGIAEVTSAVDAFTMMQAEKRDGQIKEETSAERTARQAKGKMVSGNAPYDPEEQPKGMIVGEGGSLRELELEAQMAQMGL